MSTYATDTFAGDGSTVEFTLTFSYLSRDHIKVFRVEKSDGAETELSVITTGAPTGDEFIWESDNKIKVGTAPTVDQTLKIQRDTPEDQQLVPWSDGSYLISEDLNDSDKQWLYNIQELSDLFAGLSSEAIKYRGTIDLTVDAAPANPTNGDFYINSGSGTVLASWTGLGGDNVTGSEQVIYNSSLGEWELLKTPASQKGVLELSGTAPIQVDNTDAQRPVVSVDAATTTAAGVINEAASDGITYGRENGAWVAVANTAVSANPPANPGNGDGWYDLNTGRLYLWINDGDSSQWAEANPGLAGGGASVEVDDTPPTNPSDGDLWWDSSDDSGRLYVYYEDGSTNQWVEASPPAAANPTVKVSDTAPANPEPGDLWWDSSETGGDNGGRLYFRYSDGDSEQWVQTSNVGGANGQIWGRTGTTISPATAGDDVDLGTGDLSAAAGTFSGVVNATSVGGRVTEINGDGAITNPDVGNLHLYCPTTNANQEVFRIFSDVGGTAQGKSSVKADGSASFGSGNITLNANGTISTDSTLGSGGDKLFRNLVNGSSRFYVTGTGQLYAKSQTIQLIGSERRLKKDINGIEPTTAWETIKSTPYYSYKFIDSDSVSYGPIVDEVPAEMVIETDQSDDQGVIRTYDNGMLQARLYVALQTALTRIEALEARLATLEGN